MTFRFGVDYFSIELRPNSTIKMSTFFLYCKNKLMNFIFVKAKMKNAINIVAKLLRLSILVCDQTMSCLYHCMYTMDLPCVYGCIMLQYTNMPMQIL